MWQPFFTPSRSPLIYQRWTVLAPEAQGIPIFDRGARYPGGSQYGARYNHIGAHKEGSGGLWQQMGYQGLDPEGITKSIRALL